MYLPFLSSGCTLAFSGRSVQQAIIRQRRAALILALALTPAIPLITVGIEELGWVLDAPVFVLVMVLGCRSGPTCWQSSAMGCAT